MGPVRSKRGPVRHPRDVPGPEGAPGCGIGSPAVGQVCGALWQGKRPNEAALLTPEALSHLISKVNVFWILLVSLVFPSGSAVFMDIFLESWSL